MPTSTTKFSQFNSGGLMKIGDFPVGLRNDVNTIFNFPGTGIEDSSGNTLIAWSSAGTLAVNYISFSSAETGNNISINALGTDDNVGINYLSQGDGYHNFYGFSSSIQVWINSSSETEYLIHNISSLTTNRTITWPDASGTVAFAGSSAESFTTDSGTATPSSGVIIITGSSTGLTSTGSGNTIGFTGTLSVGHGGSGLSTTPTNGQLLIGNGTNYTLSTLTAGTGVSVTNGTGSITLAATNVSSGTINDLAYYASTGSTISGLATANSSVLVTSSGGVPSLSTTLPSGISATSMNLTSPVLGTPTSGTLTNCTGLPLTTGVTGILPVSNGGSGLSTVPTNGQLLIGNGTNYTLSTITAGTGISVSNSSGGITLSATNVSSGTINQLAYYASTGSVVSGLATANNSVLVTSSGGVPSLSTTLPSGISATSMTLITPLLGTPTSGILTNCTGLPLTTGVTGVLPIVNGGTNSNSSLANGLLMISNGGSIVEINTAVSAGGQRITNLSDPTNSTDAATKEYVDTVAGTGLIPQGNWNASTNTPTLTAGIGTVGYYYYVSVPGTQTLPSGTPTTYAVGDFIYYGANAIWNRAERGVSVVSINNASGLLTLEGDGTGNQIIVSTSGQTIELTLPQAIGTMSSPTFSDLTLSSLTASEAVVTNGSNLLTSLAYVSTNTASTLVVRDSSGNFSAGTITASLTGNSTSATNISGGLANQIPYQTGASSTSFISSAASSVLITNGSSVPSLSTTLPSNLSATSMTLVTPVLGTPTSGTLTNCTGLPLTTGVTGILPVSNGGSGLSTTPANGQLLIGNATNYTLSTLTAGTGISVTNGTGSITLAATNVSSGTANQLAYYASTGSVVSGLATANSSVLVTSSGGVPSLSTTLPASISMTTPKITTSINDLNGNTILGFTPAASAVNYLSLTNAITGQYPIISPAGSDTNINIGITSKASGSIIFEANPGSIAYFLNYSNPANGIVFNISSLSSLRSMAWPDTAGTVGIQTQTDTSFTPTDGSGASLSFSTVVASYTLIGSIINFSILLTYPVTVSASAAIISSLPVSSYGRVLVTAQGLGLSFGMTGLITGGTSSINLFNSVTNVAITNAQLSGQQITISGSYSN